MKTNYTVKRFPYLIKCWIPKILEWIIRFQPSPSHHKTTSSINRKTIIFEET